MGTGLYTFTGDERLHEQTRLIWGCTLKILEKEKPASSRQIFYRLESMGVVEKSKAGYRKVQRAILAMRRKGYVPYDHVVDHGRWVREPLTHDGLVDAMEYYAETYRRDIWANQSEYVLVWIEKNALSGVVKEVTDVYAVPLYVGVGYSSESYLWETAERLKGIKKPIHLYYFGDHDASGKDAARVVREKLAYFGADLSFVEAAVNEEQIYSMNLPTRPPKPLDTRARKWGNRPNVELDAILPSALRSMVKDCIVRHLDQQQMEYDLEDQAAERRKLGGLARALLS